jgi:hypothetical protein
MDSREFVCNERAVDLSCQRGISRYKQNKDRTGLNGLCCRRQGARSAHDPEILAPEVDSEIGDSLEDPQSRNPCLIMIRKSTEQGEKQY